MNTKQLLSVQMAAAGVMTSSAYAHSAPKPHADPKSGHFEAGMGGKVAVK